ncbi:MAG: GNAT family N-acetyltransferase [Tepidisphaeraceae bacterium]
MVRRPHPAEKRACRMLLPRATEAGQRSLLLVAAAGEPQRVIGAAALGIDRQRDDRLWLVDLHVIEPLRRRGVGRALLNRVIEEAKTRGVTSLRAWDWAAPDSPSVHALTRLGFTICQRKHDHEVDLREALAALAPLLERVRDRIPPGARIVPLAETDLEAVARLHEQYLGGNPRLLRPLLSGSAANRYDPQMSSVLLLDGRVVGTALGRVFLDGSCEVDSRVLHPSVRRRWANVWLMHEGMRRIVEHGVRVMRYFTLDQHEDTRQLSERFGGVVTSSSVRMGFVIPPSPTAGRPGSGGPAGAAE